MITFSRKPSGILSPSTEQTQHTPQATWQWLQKPKTRLWLLGVGFCSILIWIANLMWFKPFDINWFYERVFIEKGLDDPELLSRLHLLDAYGLKYQNDELTNISDSSYEERYQSRIARNFDLLKSYKRSQQSAAQLLSTDILDAYLEKEILRHEFYRYEHLVNHIDGVSIDLPNFMMEVHQIHTLSDAEDYLERLSKFGQKFEQLHQVLDKRRNDNLLPPRHILERVINELKIFISTDYQYHPLYKDFNRKVAESPHILEKARQELKIEIKQAIEDEVFPAYQNHIAYLESLLEDAPTDISITHMGEEAETSKLYYTFAFSAHTYYAPEFAEDAHLIGLKEVSRLQGEMRFLLDSLGFDAQTGIDTLLRQISELPAFSYAHNEMGEKACLADYQTHSNHLQEVLPLLFHKPPTKALSVLRLQKALEGQMPLLAYQPADEKGKAVLYANLRNLNESPTFAMPARIYAEILGKHLFLLQQNPQEAELRPTFRKLLHFPAFTEGWTHYSLHLLQEKGYWQNPYARLGWLQKEIFIAALLATDTGVHLKGWTRQEAIDFLVRHTGFSADAMANEVDKIAVKPGQACTAKMGELRFLELRKLAEQRLGAKFNLRDFHHLLLKDGEMPLSILQKQVEKYIATTLEKEE
ncbi:DUF885 domain-containing protein [Hugenholtzia roseola]|uniref:DUF885 domain-containing protein n=1 Tax=Hugenholtzia roseola TaxID=1002 RepID=UPI0003F63F3E|nr:DUF885 domain-containing protein [Hugenholtzia roseola]